MHNFVNIKTMELYFKQMNCAVSILYLNKNFCEYEILPKNKKYSFLFSELETFCHLSNFSLITLTESL